MRIHLGAINVPVTPQLQTMVNTITKVENVNPSYNNPCALMYAGQPGASGAPNQLARFDTLEDGINACYNQIGLYASGACQMCNGQPLTIGEMMAIYCPAGAPKCDPTTYANIVASAMGVSTSTQVADAIAGNAGNTAASGAPQCTDDGDPCNSNGCSFDADACASSGGAPYAGPVSGGLDPAAIAIAGIVGVTLLFVLSS